MSYAVKKESDCCAPEMAAPKGQTSVIADTIRTESTTAAAPAREAPAVLESRDLFAGRTEILIRHDGALYRMKITRQNKLILNK